jgi:uncharacterized repeat protein (TIGR03803 family)
MVASLAAGDAAAWTLKTLHAFCDQVSCADGSSPHAGLVVDAGGNLYGTAQFGGANNRGVLFELKPRNGNWKYRVLYSFCAEDGCVDGSIPSAGLILDAAGNLYGTTETGGANNCGTVFKFEPRRARRTTLYDFCSAAADAKFPLGGLTYQGQAGGAPYDGKAPLYGTSWQGGAQGQGAVYALARKHMAWSESVLHDFCARDACADGEAPMGDLIVDGAGNLYGNTTIGGSFGHGVVFELSPGRRTWKETVLYDFCQLAGCADGDRPLGALLMDPAGDLLGTTSLGPGEAGNLFKLAPNGGNSQETILYTFCAEPSCTDGYTPMAGLIADGAGNLFGTTAFGGTSGAGAGTVFMLTGTQHIVLYNFCSQSDCADGAFPEAPLIMDAAGNLYGTTAGGVGSTRGSVFELTP